MNTLFDYGEFLICIGPIFLVIASVGLLLLANSWPKREPKKRNSKSNDGDKTQDIQ